MIMKSTTQREHNTVSFPMLILLDNGCVLLASNERSGVIVRKANADNAMPLGETTTYTKDSAIPFTGAITLENS